MGHDLNRGTSSFSKTVGARAARPEPSLPSQAPSGPVGRVTVDRGPGELGAGAGVVGGRPDPESGSPRGPVPELGFDVMADYVFTLRNVRKAHGDKVVLDNVTLSFLHGAKIGVVGPNGTGKSSLLKIMAGSTTPSNGDAILDPDATVGMLQQEPPLTEGKTVLENVEEAVGEIKAKLDRLQRDLRRAGRPGRRLRQAARRDGRPADRPRPRQRVGPRQPARPGDGRAALPAAGHGRRHPLRW